MAVRLFCAIVLSLCLGLVVTDASADIQSKRSDSSVQLWSNGTTVGHWTDTTTSAVTSMNISSIYTPGATFLSGNASHYGVVAGNDIYTQAYTLVHWEIFNATQGTNKLAKTYSILVKATNSGNNNLTLVGKLRAVADTRFESTSNGSSVSHVTTVELREYFTGSLLYSQQASALASGGIRQLSTSDVNYAGTLAQGWYTLTFTTVLDLSVVTASGASQPYPFIEAGTDYVSLPNWKHWEVTIGNMQP